jgi:hypothetical protein
VLTTMNILAIVHKTSTKVVSYRTTPNYFRLPFSFPYNSYLLLLLPLPLPSRSLSRSRPFDEDVPVASCFADVKSRCVRLPEFAVCCSERAFWYSAVGDGFYCGLRKDGSRGHRIVIRPYGQNHTKTR